MGMLLFLERLKFVMGIVIQIIFVLALIVAVAFWEPRFHLPDIVRTWLAWICLGALACCVIGLFCILCAAAYSFVKWLFVEPFQKGRGE